MAFTLAHASLPCAARAESGFKSADLVQPMPAVKTLERRLREVRQRMTFPVS
jgi:hypothetical protein